MAFKAHGAFQANGVKVKQGTMLSADQMKKIGEETMIELESQGVVVQVVDAKPAKTDKKDKE